MIRPASSHYDVLIVGGGPAGLSAGIVLAGCGLHTLVCERKRLPVDKACGEGLMPPGVDGLHRLGVTGYLQPTDFSLFRGIRYHSPHGLCAEGLFPSGPGWGIRRTALARALAERAGELDSLEILDGARLQGLARAPGQITAVVEGRPVSARLLVGADGLHSQIRRWAGLQGPPAQLQRWGIRQHFARVSSSILAVSANDGAVYANDFVEVCWGDGLEAYLTPCGEARLNVAFLWDRRRRAEIRGGPGLIPSLIKTFPTLRERLEGYLPCSRPQAAGPLLQIARAPVAEGTILIGDAAGYLDALTGEGLNLAIQEAICLAETVAPLLRNKSPQGTLLSARDLAPYARAWQEINRPSRQLTLLALFLSQRPAWAEAAVRLLARQPALFRFLLGRMARGSGQIRPRLYPSTG